MCVPIQWVSRDGRGNITHVGGSSPRGVVWGLSTREAWLLIEQQMWQFFVEVAGVRAGVFAVRRGGADFLATSPDGVGVNNLDTLPVNPQQLAGVLPEFPLSLPGVDTMKLMRVKSVQYAAGGQLRSLTSKELKPGISATKLMPPASFWTQNPRWLYLDVLVPFPSEVNVSETSSLTRVPGDSPGTRRALEAAGKGWWSIEYLLTRPDGSVDPAKPSRVTEARIIVRPAKDWALGRVDLTVACFSLNTYCYTSVSRSRSGQSVQISLAKPAVPAPPATPMVTVPNVVGQRLDLALSTLWAAKFIVTVSAPVAASTNLRVTRQDLAPGTKVKEGSGILLSAALITPEPGVKSLAIENHSNRAAPLDIWLYDYTTGAWSKKTTIAYQASGQVSFEDGHLYWVAAVDDTTPLCDSGRPDEPACVYATPGVNIRGDENGLTNAWTVT